ncbi:MAG: LuxR C-terminal-related transcriptional regulator [Acidimicrobiales bacterium]
MNRNEDPAGGPDLPAGTVTFLFTDIEGSTRRWESFPVDMARCVAEHDQLLRTAVLNVGGHVVKSTGDGVMAAFDNADAALAAAIAGQAAVGGHEWGPVPPLRIRMGIHQGRAYPVAGDYFGVTVNRTARVADSGHGAQIIVSAAAAGTMHPPSGISLLSRGFHRLKDLSEPLELYEAVQGAERELLPLRTVDVLRNRLPVQRTAFIGREREMRRASTALDEGRLVTLCGPGGVGKTRLALQIAAELAARFSDGAHFVDLSNAHAGDDLAPIVADQLGLLGRRSVPMNAGGGSIEAEMAGKNLLVVLDNCEHIADAAAALVHSLLGAPAVSCLVTSREPLRIAGEALIRVEPFEEVAGNDPAVELFLERARAAAGTDIASTDRQTVSAVCALVDRLPLAIELAAARTAHLPLGELHRRLQQHHRVLSSKERDRAERHRTVELLLSWSVSMLPPAERAVFARLGTFVGSVPLTAIEAVCQGPPVEGDDVLDVVASLVDRSLLVTDPQSGTYRMLGLVRSFAADQLAGANDAGAVGHRYWAWCAGLGPEADDEALRGIVDRYADEVFNAVATATTAGDAAAALAITSWAWRIWEMTGRIHDGIAALQRALQLEGGGPEPVRRARTCNGLAALLLAQGDAQAAQHLHLAALDLFAAEGNETGQGWSLIGLSMASLRAGDVTAAALKEATDKASRAIALFEGTDDRRGFGHSHVAAGIVNARRGENEAAEQHFLHALAAFRLDHRRRDAVAALVNLANLAIDRDHLLRASRFLDGAHQLSIEIGDRRSAGMVLNNLCLVASRRGDHRQAGALAREAHEHFEAVGDDLGAAIAQLHIANTTAIGGGAAETVAAYSDAVERFRSASDVRGVLTALANLSDYAWRNGEHNIGWRREVERATIAARLDLTNTLHSSLGVLAGRARELGDAGLADRLGAAIQANSPATAVLEEIRAAPPAAASVAVNASAPADVASLSARERELLRLLGEGLTNEELAERLYVSRRTVDAHLSHIRTKLRITDRVKLAVLARTWL